MPWQPNRFKIYMEQLHGNVVNLLPEMESMGLSKPVVNWREPETVPAALDAWRVAVRSRGTYASLTTPWTELKDWPELLELLWWLDHRQIIATHETSLRVLVDVTGLAQSEQNRLTGGWYCHEGYLLGAVHPDHLHGATRLSQVSLGDLMAYMVDEPIVLNQPTQIFYMGSNILSCDLYHGTSNRAEVVGWVTLLQAMLQQWIYDIPVPLDYEEDNQSVASWYRTTLSRTRRAVRASIDNAVSNWVSGKQLEITMDLVRRRLRV